MSRRVSLAHGAIALAVAVVASACVTPMQPASEDVVARYAAGKGAGRPADVLDGVRSGRLVEGMNVREAAMCLGRASDAERIRTGQGTTEVWTYRRPSVRKGAGMWSPEVVLARLEFTNGVLAAWVDYTVPRKVPAEESTAGKTPAVRSGAAPRSVVLRPDAIQSAAEPAGGHALVLSGTVGTAGNCVAIVNGRMVSAGETVDGALVRRITPEGIEVEAAGRIEFIPAPGKRRP